METKLMGYFTIESKSEYAALVWATTRWEGSRVLYDLMHPPVDWDGVTFPVTMGLTEWEARKVQEAIDAEDPGFTPCLVDGLNARILAMLVEVTR